MQVPITGSSFTLAPQAATPAMRAQQDTRALAPESAQSEPATSSTNGSAKNSPDASSVQDAAKRLQDFVSVIRNDIQFSLDTDSGDTVVKVIDRDSQEILRQIPSKEALEIARALDQFKGLFVKQQA